MQQQRARLKTIPPFYMHIYKKMASFSPPNTLPFTFLLLLPLCCFICASLGGEMVHKHHNEVDIRSLLPTQTCSSSFKDVSSSSEEEGRLRVANRHGPCSPLTGHKPISDEQILDGDQARVDNLHRRTSSVLSNHLDQQHPDSLSAFDIPAHGGASLGTGNYVVVVGFGTPKKTQTVIFDTGSDVTWIQCQPCVVSCYQQQDPLFNPTQSSTYANISCSSEFCSELSVSGCSSSTCLYGVQYGDQSFTVGFYAEDTLTLSPSDVIPRFRFGCGERNGGLFGEAAGLMGLGRGKPSIVSQASQRYGGVFAYCLPTTSSSTGYLTFGEYPTSSSNLQFTPMLSSARMPTFYYLSLTGISVGGQQLPVSAAVFAAGGSILDSGTVITRLPPTAYAALRSAFRQAMARYKTAPALSILDTCYDLSGERSVIVPTVELQLGGGARMELGAGGTLYTASSSQVCLAFAPNGADSDLGILGNVQQKGFDVVYDVSKRVIGFRAGGCT